MRVLVIDEEIPFPLNSGKRIRTFNLLKHLAARHEIVFVCRHHEGIEGPCPKPLEDMGIRTIVVPHLIRKKAGPKFYLALIANLFSVFPYSVSSHYSRQLVDAIRGAMRRSEFDLIHCEWTPYALNIREFLPVPSVVVAHNVESVIWRRSFEVEPHPLKKAYIYFQWKKMKQFERRVFPLFTRTTAVSRQDKTRIAKWIPDDRISVISNGVDVDYFRASGLPEEPHSIVFTGALDWRPAVDCMLYFLDEVWPLVLKAFPDCFLTIVGRRPMAALKDRVANSECVRLTGTVDDVRPYIEKCSVYIVPLRVGGGSRLKILEALAMGKAVVSTTIGAEGLEVVPEEHLLIADDAQSFATAIGRFFQDPKLRQCSGNAGRALVEKKYQWKFLADILEQVWFKAANSSSFKR